MKKNRIQLSAPPLYPKVFEGLLWIGLVFFMGCVGGGIFFDTPTLIFIGILGIAIGIYGGWIEPFWIRTAFYREVLSDSPKASMRIVFVSDLHAGGYKTPAFYARVVNLIQAHTPDMLLLGGDYVYAGSAAVQDLASFAQIQCSQGKYFVLGNHDFDDDPEEIRHALCSYGFSDLTNRSVTLEKEGKQAALVGLDDAWFGAPKVEELESVSSPKILLTHEPDILFDLPEKAADLVLLGHTHAGQIRWPFFGPVSPLPQDAPQFLDRGRRTWRGMPIIISSGLGESGSRVRFLARPEIVVIDVSW